MSMYQGNNPTALHSQRLLLEALHALLADKALKDISVSELCSRSGVSRQTFYSLFGTKENMLRAELEKAIQAQKPTPEDAARLTLWQMCVRYGEFTVAHYAQLKMLVENDLLDLLNAQFYKTMSTCRESYVNVSDEERDYAALFTSAGLSCLTRKYILQHDVPNAEALARLSYKMMSGGIYRG